MPSWTLPLQFDVSRILNETQGFLVSGPFKHAAVLLIPAHVPLFDNPMFTCRTDSQCAHQVCVCVSDQQFIFFFKGACRALYDCRLHLCLRSAMTATVLYATLPGPPPPKKKVAQKPPGSKYVAFCFRTFASMEFVVSGGIQSGCVCCCGMIVWLCRG